MSRVFWTLTFDEGFVANDLSMAKRVASLLPAAHRLGLRLVSVENGIDKIRRQAVEECCAAVCTECGFGSDVEKDAGGVWFHPRDNTLCNAHPIREKLLDERDAHDEDPDELLKLHQIIDGLADRVAAQSELLARHALKEDQRSSS